MPFALLACSRIFNSEAQQEFFEQNHVVHRPDCVLFDGHSGHSRLSHTHTLAYNGLRGLISYICKYNVC